MKTYVLVLISILLSLSGCASSSTKATIYCDQNWHNRYNTWQDCYDRQLGQQNKGLRAFANGLKGMGDGLKGGRNCVTTQDSWGNYITKCE